MATLIDPDFRARLNALNEKYAAGVPALMLEIGTAAQRCATEGAQPANLAALQKSLHTVAGSAATFGFATLGAQCRVLEQNTRLAGAAADGGVSAWPDLAIGVAQLLRWAERDPKASTYGPAGV